MSSNEIALRLDCEQTIHARDKVEALLNQARDLVMEAQKLADNVGADFEVLTYYKQGEFSIFSKRSPVPAVMKYFDACAWDRFFEASGVGQFMSMDARLRWKQAIQERKVEKLTPENIKATFKGLMDQASEFLVDGAVALAKTIAWDRVTNNPTAVTSKCILKSFCQSDRSIRQGSLGTLDDLDRCLRTIEGMEGPPLPASTWEYRVLSYKYEQAYEGTYFDIRICPSVGTCHVTFNARGVKLLPELNRLIATRYPSVLPPVRTRKSK
jgi:hypothetical protein